MRLRLRGSPSHTTVRNGYLRGGAFHPWRAPPSLASLERQLAALRTELHAARRAACGAEGYAITQAQAAEELRRKRAAQHRQEVRTVEAHGRRASGSATADRFKVERKLAEARSQRDVQYAMANRCREEIKGMVTAQAVIEVQAAWQLELDAVSADLRASADACRKLEELTEEYEERDEQQSRERKEAAADERAAARAVTTLNRLLDEIGLMPGYFSVPPRAPDSNTVRRRSRIHMEAVLRDRGEGTDINLVADALHNLGYLDRLLAEANRCQSWAKAMATKAVVKVQAHWTARHAVHVWDRLELTRSKMETLRHLLSHTYNPVANAYNPIRVWEHPTDKSDFLLAPALAARHAREREFASIAAQQNIVVNESGRCERDAIKCTSLLYTNYRLALRPNYDINRPAQPILFLDGTGGALGRGICHGEMGCADFIAVGDSDAKQSRATLQPLFLYEGTDHTHDLRGNIELAITSYNQLVDQAYFYRGDPADSSVEERVQP